MPLNGIQTRTDIFEAQPSTKGINDQVPTSSLIYNSTEPPKFFTDHNANVIQKLTQILDFPKTGL